MQSTMAMWYRGPLLRLCALLLFCWHADSLCFTTQRQASSRCYAVVTRSGSVRGNVLKTSKSSSRIQLSMATNSSEKNNEGPSNDNDKNKPVVRFSGSSQGRVLEAVAVDDGTNAGFFGANLLDGLLSLIVSDAGSVVLGLVGLIILIVVRLAEIDEVLSPTAQGQQTRSSLLAVFATGAVLLNGISNLDVTTAIAEVVELNGVTLKEPLIALPTEDMQDSAGTIKWALQALLEATPTKSAVLLQYQQSEDTTDLSWRIVAMSGVVASKTPAKTPENTPILNRILLTRQSQREKAVGETYLPTLQNLPGRVEFTYLPDNTQAVLIVPVSDSSSESDSASKIYALVLGSNQARSYTPKDINWCQAISTRIGTDLS